jgi:hypothetical protein
MAFAALAGATAALALALPSILLHNENTKLEVVEAKIMT